MEVLRAAAQIKMAYSKAGMWNLLTSAFLKSAGMEKLMVRLLACMYVGIAVGFIVTGERVLLVGLAGVVGAFLYFGPKAVDSAHRELLANFGEIDSRFRTNRLFLRYLIFRESLDEELNANRGLLERAMQTLRELDAEGRQTVSNSPVKAGIIAAYVALVGGLANHEVAWTEGILVKLILLVVFVHVATYVFGEFAKSNRRKFAELNTFVRWRLEELN